MNKTIHYMTGGQAYCGFPGFPKDWPDDHLWAADWEHVTCKNCKDAKPKIEAAEMSVDLSKPVPKQKPRAPAEKRREPRYNDDDRMPFGKHRGELLMDVPANYFHWLWQQRPITDKMLENYIFNNIER